MKIATHITFFYNKDRIKYLNQVVDGFNTIEGNEIFIHTNTDIKLSDKENVHVIYHDLKNEHPFYLTWKSRKTIKEQIGQYDYYIYSEDDGLFTKENFYYYLKYHEILKKQNFNVGFLRIEKKDNKIFLVDQDRKFSHVIEVEGNKFIINDISIYQSMWICDNEELSRFINDFSDIYDFRRTYYGGGLSMSRENAAIGMIFKYRNSLVKNEEGCFIQHIPNTYSNIPQSKYGKLEKDTAFNQL